MILVTLKIQQSLYHNPRDKKEGTCPVGMGTYCSDKTGAHHTVLCQSWKEVDEYRREFHVTRVEEVK